jgi:hypothetical protein
MVVIAASGFRHNRARSREIVFVAIAEEGAVAARKNTVFLASDPDAPDRIPRSEPRVDLIDVKAKNRVRLKPR